jgi:hypothetical protein
MLDIPWKLKPPSTHNIIKDVSELKVQIPFQKWLLPGKQFDPVKRIVKESHMV